MAEEKTTEELTPEAKPETGGKEYVPRSKYNELNETVKTLSDKIKAYEEAEDASKKKKLEEEGKYKELAKTQEDTIKSLQAKADEWEAFQTKERGKLLESLPKESREAFKDANLTILQEVVAISKKEINSPGNEHLAAADTTVFKDLNELSEAFQTGKITMEKYKSERAKFVKSNSIYG